MVPPNRRALGRQGESAAVGILQREGYRVLETNFTTRFGEIDVVADDAGCLCFVEVRLKTGAGFGSALESLTWTKRRHLRKAAQIYLARDGGPERDCRFDFLALEWDRRSGTSTKHVLVRNAFGADD